MDDGRRGHGSDLVTSAIFLLWRAQLRGSLRRVVALALLTALGGGITLAVAAGARRTAGAYEAVGDLSPRGELASSYVPHDPDEARRLIGKIPAVDRSSQLVGFNTLLPETPVTGLSSFAYYDDPVVADRPIVLEGRMPEAANELFANEAAAAGAGVSVGEPIEVVIASPDFTDFRPQRMVVVGIGLFADEVYEDETGAKPALVYAKKFVDAHRDVIVWGAASVRVAPGADRADAVAQMLERGLVIDNDAKEDRDQAGAAIRPLAVTLGVLALLAGLATIAVAGQAFHRLVQRSPTEDRTLAATGCSRAMLLAADLGVTVTVAAAGALGAIGVAVAASPLFPQGRARRIPALRGVDVDPTILGLGALALLVALTGAVAVTSLRRTRVAELRPGSAPGVLGIDPAVSTGVRFATGRRGLLGTVGGIAAGLTAVIAAVVFTGSTDHLVSRPELAGFSWDLLGRNAYAMIDTRAVADRLADHPDVERITGLTFTDVTVDGASLPASVWQPIEGSPWPPLVTGRAPQGPNEVLFSPRTLDELGYEVGDTVAVGFSAVTESQPRDIEIEMTVVGTAVSPPVGIPGAGTPRLDEGVLVHRDDIPAEVEFGSAVLFDLVDGAGAQSVRRHFPGGLPDEFEGGTDWFETTKPSEVIQSDDAIDVLILAITALLIGVMATVAHNLLGFVRERRNAFAVLRALGFTSRQIRSTVLWQSGLVVGAALLLAVPLGIAAGRSLYQAFASDIGVIVEPVVPLLALLAAVLGTFTLVQLVALVPARQARRASAATDLRGE